MDEWKMSGRKKARKNEEKKEKRRRQTEREKVRVLAMLYRELAWQHL
jgi:hypothetical protein